MNSRQSHKPHGKRKKGSLRFAEGKSNAVVGQTSRQAKQFASGIMGKYGFDRNNYLGMFALIFKSKGLMTDKELAAIKNPSDRAWVLQLQLQLKSLKHPETAPLVTKQQTIQQIQKLITQSGHRLPKQVLLEESQQEDKHVSSEPAPASADMPVKKKRGRKSKKDKELASQLLTKLENVHVAKDADVKTVQAGINVVNKRNSPIMGRSMRQLVASIGMLAHPTSSKINQPSHKVNGVQHTGHTTNIKQKALHLLYKQALRDGHSLNSTRPSKVDGTATVKANHVSVAQHVDAIRGTSIWLEQFQAGKLSLGQGEGKLVGSRLFEPTMLSTNPSLLTTSDRISFRFPKTAFLLAVKPTSNRGRSSLNSLDRGFLNVAKLILQEVTQTPMSRRGTSQPSSHVNHDEVRRSSFLDNQAVVYRKSLKLGEGPFSEEATPSTVRFIRSLLTKHAETQGTPDTPTSMQPSAETALGVGTTPMSRSHASVAKGFLAAGQQPLAINAASLTSRLPRSMHATAGSTGVSRNGVWDSSLSTTRVWRKTSGQDEAAGQPQPSREQQAHGPEIEEVVQTLQQERDERRLQVSESGQSQVIEQQAQQVQQVQQVQERDQQVQEVGLAESTIQPSVEQPVKRKRGRPRKNNGVIQESKETANEIIAGSTGNISTPPIEKSEEKLIPQPEAVQLTDQEIVASQRVAAVTSFPSKVYRKPAVKENERTTVQKIQSNENWLQQLVTIQRQPSSNGSSIRSANSVNREGLQVVSRQPTSHLSNILMKPDLSSDVLARSHSKLNDPIIKRSVNSSFGPGKSSIATELRGTSRLHRQLGKPVVESQSFPAQQVIPKKTQQETQKDQLQGILLEGKDKLPSGELAYELAAKIADASLRSMGALLPRSTKQPSVEREEVEVVRLMRRALRPSQASENGAAGQQHLGLTENKTTASSQGLTVKHTLATEIAAKVAQSSMNKVRIRKAALDRPQLLQRTVTRATASIQDGLRHALADQQNDSGTNHRSARSEVHTSVNGLSSNRITDVATSVGNNKSDSHSPLDIVRRAGSPSRVNQVQEQQASIQRKIDLGQFISRRPTLSTNSQRSTAINEESAPASSSTGAWRRGQLTLRAGRVENGTLPRRASGAELEQQRLETANVAEQGRQVLQSTDRMNDTQRNVQEAQRLRMTRNVERGNLVQRSLDMANGTQVRRANQAGTALQHRTASDLERGDLVQRSASNEHHLVSSKQAMIRETGRQLGKFNESEPRSVVQRDVSTESTAKIRRTIHLSHDQILQRNVMEGTNRLERKSGIGTGNLIQRASESRTRQLINRVSVEDIRHGASQGSEDQNVPKRKAATGAGAQAEHLRRQAIVDGSEREHMRKAQDSAEQTIRAMVSAQVEERAQALEPAAASRAAETVIGARSTRAPRARQNASMTPRVMPRLASPTGALRAAPAGSLALAAASGRAAASTAGAQRSASITNSSSQGWADAALTKPLPTQVQRQVRIGGGPQGNADVQQGTSPMGVSPQSVRQEHLAAPVGMLEHKQAPASQLASTPLEMDWLRTKAGADQEQATAVQVDQAPPELSEEQLQELIKQLPQLDIGKIADKVYREIEKKMKFERQRRGV